MPGGEWNPQHGPLVARPDLGGRWVFPGRRLLLAGSWSGGLQEIWAHPHRVARIVETLVGGAPAAAASAARTPAFGERSLAAAGGGHERWTASAAHAVGLWELSAPGAHLEVVCDLAVGVAAELLLADGERLEAVGGALEGWRRVRAAGHGRLRLVIIAGADADDLARARERVERRGVPGIAGERAQHARLVADYGAAIESPDPAEVAAFEWAKADADALLIDIPGAGRRLARRYRLPNSVEWESAGPIEWPEPGELASLAGALLAAGLREPVRDAMRAAREHRRDAEHAVLAALWQAWTGDGEPAARDALPVPPPGAPWAPLADHLLRRWGLEVAAGQSLSLAPELGAAERELALRRLRVGQSVVDVELRRRFDRVAARLQRRHGPALPVRLRLRGPAPVAVAVDDEPVGAAQVTLAVSDRHEVVFQF